MKDINLKETINQLKNLQGHCEDFLDKEDKDCIWKYDIEALEIAIETLERELKTIKGG